MLLRSAAGDLRRFPGQPCQGKGSRVRQSHDGPRSTGSAGRERGDRRRRDGALAPRHRRVRRVSDARGRRHGRSGCRSGRAARWRRDIGCARMQFIERMTSIAGVEIEEMEDFEVAFAAVGPLTGQSSGHAQSRRGGAIGRAGDCSFLRAMRASLPQRACRSPLATDRPRWLRSTCVAVGQALRQPSNGGPAAGRSPAVGPGDAHRRRETRWTVAARRQAALERRRIRALPSGSPRMPRPRSPDEILRCLRLRNGRRPQSQPRLSRREARDRPPPAGRIRGSLLRLSEVRCLRTRGWPRAHGKPQSKDRVGLVLEVPEEGPGRDVGGGGDLVDRDVVVAALVKSSSAACIRARRVSPSFVRAVPPSLLSYL